jgi:hypothetical protein
MNRKIDSILFIQLAVRKVWQHTVWDRVTWVGNIRCTQSAEPNRRVCSIPGIQLARRKTVQLAEANRGVCSILGIQLTEANGIVCRILGIYLGRREQKD